MNNIRITKAHIIQDLIDLKSKTGRLPTKKEYFKLGKFTTRTIQVRFGSWNKALLETFGKVNLEVIGLISKPCENCGIIVTRRQSDCAKNIFCSHSCCAIFSNKRRKKSCRSKIEKKLFDLLKIAFPILEILPNDKTMLDGLEVDIAIPSLKLAIEWNGIVHFKPIYGHGRLATTKDTDAKKQVVARSKDINLIVITDLVSTRKILLQAFEDISVIIRNLLNAP